MSSAAEPQTWTKRRWIYAVSGVLFIQLAAVAVLVRPLAPVPPRPTFATRVHLVSQPESQSRLGALPGLVDPALFALPSLQGYSGSAWLRYPLLEPGRAERTEEPGWLKLDPATLGTAFFQFLSTNTISPPLLVDAPLPPVLRYEASYSGEPVAPVSRLRLEGDLAGRTLTGPIELRSWPHTEILSNTTVRAAVDAAGQVFSATLLARSGLAAADEYALRFVEEARLGPVPLGRRRREGADGLTWCTFVFLWHTVPMPDTHATPALP